jgi:hypothetical protein
MEFTAQYYCSDMSPPSLREVEIELRPGSIIFHFPEKTELFPLPPVPHLTFFDEVYLLNGTMPINESQKRQCYPTAPLIEGHVLLHGLHQHHALIVTERVVERIYEFFVPPTDLLELSATRVSYPK